VSRCRSCPAEIEWVLTEQGRRMPIDVETRADGNLIVTGEAIDRGRMVPTVRYVEAGEGDRVSHFATCPNAKEHRR